MNDIQILIQLGPDGVAVLLILGVVALVVFSFTVDTLFKK